jgi:hypothetical protein
MVGCLRGIIVSVFSIDSRVSRVGEHDSGGKNDGLSEGRKTVGGSGIAGRNAFFPGGAMAVEFSVLGALALGKNDSPAFPILGGSTANCADAADGDMVVPLLGMRQMIWGRIPIREISVIRVQDWFVG